MSILKLFKHFRPFQNIAAHAERTVRSIEYTPVATLSECLTSCQPAITEMIAPGTPLPPGPLLFPEFANPTAIKDHNITTATPVPVYVASAPDIIVSGRSLAGTKTCVFDLGPTEPSYIASYMREGIVEFTGDFSLDSKTERCVDGCTALVTHWNSNTYGHWLLECLPKLFLLQNLRHHLPDLKIAISSAVSRDITRWAEFLLPDVPLVTFDNRREYLRCDRVIFPGRLSDRSYFFHPTMNDSISSIPKTAGSGKHRGIFVVRHDNFSFRKLSNKSEIMRIASEFGLDLVQPETLSIADQVKTFAGASVVVGEFGSALHNTMFSNDASVLCLGWINSLQSRIAALRQQSIGYLLPPDRKIITFSHDAPVQQYGIDPDEFAEALRRMLAMNGKE